jgi:hypothetical protein
MPPMRGHRDPDLLLVEEMLAPPPLDDARSSLAYWKRRHETLPLYRRRSRREAREMADRWRERVQAAEQARFESTLLGRLLRALGVSGVWVRREKVTKGRLLAFAWVVVPPRMKLIAGGIATAWVIVALTVGGAILFALSSAL